MNTYITRRPAVRAARPATAGTASASARALLGRIVLAALLPASMLGAQAPTVYYACYVPSSGTVYRVKEPNTPTQCGSSGKKGQQVQHIEFSWTDGAGALRVSDPAGGDLSGPLASPNVAKLLGRALSSTPPADGQVLTWNQPANAWEPKAAPGGGGASDHGALGGLADDDHSQYLLADGVRNSPNGFAVVGTAGAGAMPPVSGPGTRLMWYPAKGAFRAGYVNGSHWDDANIGGYSVAIGYSSMASGSHSVALGGGSLATGLHSFAVGGGAARAAASVAIAGEANAPAAVAIGTNTRATGEHSVALGTLAHTNGKPGAFVFGDASSSTTFVSAVADNQFVVRAGRFWFGNTSNVTATIGRYIETSTGAFLSTGGTWTNSSDSTRKTAFHGVDAESVLARLAAMPIRTWRYRDEDSTVRHIGPTAQDFRAAFGLGDSDTAIATVDADGVALAAIQALAKRTETLTAENAFLGRTNVTLRSELDTLGERLRAIEAQLSALALQGSTSTGQR